MLQVHLSAIYGKETMVFFDGSLSVAQRTTAINAFQTDNAVRIFLASTTSACRGITLTAATRIVHLDVPASESTVDQSTKRAHRIGQESPVHVHHLMSTGTIDEALIDFVHKDRRELSGRIMEGGGGAAASAEPSAEPSPSPTVFSDPVGLFTTLSKLYQEKLKPRFEEPAQPVAVGN